MYPNNSNNKSDNGVTRALKTEDSLLGKELDTTEQLHNNNKLFATPGL